MSDTPITDALEAQGDIQPGDEGWWKVWGASVRDIQPGDMVMLKYADEPDKHFEYEVEAYDPRVPDHASISELLNRARDGGKVGDMRDMIRPRFRTPSGEHFTVGALQPIALLRRATHNLLSDYVT